MATTSQILRWVELENPGWLREGPRGSRALLNEAHKILNLGEREEMLIYDDATGQYPFFTTTAGTFLYTCPNNVWRVAAILVDRDNAPSDVDRTWVLNDYSEGGRDYYWVENIKTRQYYNENRLAQVRFNVDPGDQTAMFRRKAYRMPVDITSDAVQHECPGATDTRYLLPATSALIAAVNDVEKMQGAYQYIETVLKPAYWKNLDGGYQGGPVYVTKRQF